VGDSPLTGSSQVLGGRMLRALGPCNFVNLGSLRFTRVLCFRPLRGLTKFITMAIGTKLKWIVPNRFFGISSKS
jgi:hypothetical protein